MNNPTHHFVDAVAIDDATGRITHVGSLDDAAIVALEESATYHNLKGRLLLPSFIDGYIHLLIVGQSLKKAVLTDYTSLEDIRQIIKEYAAANPKYERILCRG